MRVLRRFVVAENSMQPTLQPGDGLLAARSKRVARGQIRCFEHPHRPGFWLVKRVGEIRGRGPATEFEARSDNTVDGVVDSRQLGWIPAAGTYRVILRLPARGSTQQPPT